MRAHKKQTTQRRQDADIASEIIEAIRRDVRIPKGGVAVSVAHGMVTLAGAVEWEFQRNAARFWAHSVPGVNGVICNLRIEPQAEAAAAQACWKMAGVADVMNRIVVSSRL